MTTVRIKPLIVAAALLSLVLPAAAWATDYYVALDGSDANAGTTYAATRPHCRGI
jgi:hypothetical protein